jgi:hypothetical protein
MSNYVTTNIRILEEDYLKLKEDAAKKRTSFSAIIRDKISVGKINDKSPDEILKRIRKHAASNVNYLEGVDIVKTLREMRYQGKW